MLDICTISISQAVTKIVDEVELHIHFKFPKAVKLCQFLNFSQMWYVACPQDLLDFSLTDLMQPRTYYSCVFEESNLFQSRTKTATEWFTACIYLYAILYSERVVEEKNAISLYLRYKRKAKSGSNLQTCFLKWQINAG